MSTPPQRAPGADLPPSRQWRLAGRLILVAVFLAALVYLLVQWRLLGRLGDPVFVGVLVANAVTIYRVGDFLQPGLVHLFDVLGGPLTGTAAQRAIFDAPAALLAAPAFAAIVTAGAAAIAPWHDLALDTALCGLVFAANLIVGLALHALWTYWRLTRMAVAALDLRILHLSQPAISLLLRTNSVIVLATAVVATLAVLAVILSKFVANPLTLAFSAFSLLVIAAAYVIATQPISARLIALKQTELDRLDGLIDAQYRAATGDDAPAPPSPAPRADLDTLLALRDRVRMVRTFPPNGEFSLSTAAWVTFLSFLPTLVDYLLTH
jgi:hypothetical protein